MASMPNMELDIAIPTNLSKAAKRVRTGVPDINARLVLGVLAAAVLGPLGLAAAYLGFVVTNFFA